MHGLEVALAAMAGLALVVGLFQHGLRRYWVNEPILALLLGVLLSPAVLGWLDLARYGDERELLEVVARLTLAVALVAVGLDLRGYLPHHRRPLAVLVFGGAALMWAAGTLLVGSVLGLSPVEALLVGAILAPTDPILAATVVTGRVAREYLPERLRHLLAAEAAARHGLGLLLVLLPVMLLTHPAPDGWTRWLVDVLLWKGVAAVAAGAVFGLAVGRAQRWSAARDLTEGKVGPLTAVFLALSLATVAAVELAGSDGLLAVLAAGITFARARTGEEKGEEVRRQERHYEELLKQVLQVPVFVLFGAALPWAAWAELGWRGPILVVLVLLLRRLPAVLLLKPVVRELHRWDEALFVGWFGPVGVGALYLAAVAHRETGLEVVWTVATLLIAASVAAHDLTATPLSRWLASRRADADSAN